MQETARRRATVAAALGLVLLLGAGRPAAASEAAHPSQVYVRTPRDIAGTVRFLELEAQRIGATDVTVAFDVATFDPPPGLTEFTLEYPFFSDLPKWLRALDDWGERARHMLRGTTSLGQRSIDLTEPGARQKLEDLVLRSWWQGERPARLPSAAAWMGSILQRTEDAVRAVSAKPTRMFVLVTCSVTPERWVRQDPEHGYESEWRTKLRKIGTYFDEGRVGAALNAAGARLYVIAPEARFGDFTPYVEMPELPWVARPHLPSDSLRSRVGQTRRGRSRGGMRKTLDDALRDTIPDDEERRKRIDEILRGAGATTPAPPPRAPGIATPHDGGLRFLASTPVWFHMCGGTVPFNNHAPSGYGIWPYARAAAKTGGRYVFYPFPESRWLDHCPADYSLINDLAPELAPRGRYLANRRGDHALSAIARAAALVMDDTPWADTWFDHRAARAWSAFRGTNPLRLEKKAFQRRKPYDAALQGSEHGIERIGHKLGEDTLPLYDRALALLDKAVARCRREAPEGVHRRSHAHLLLARFWFAMSAFHLDAYGIYAREIERFIPETMKGHVDRVFVTYVPTIRMSDVLDAYDGRKLSLQDEAKYGRWVPASAPGYQGNILDIPVEEPDYRARRNLGRVLAHLDPRLRRRALKVIDTARDVMRSYGRTGWGWSTYYAEAFTFVFKPVEVRRGHQPSRGGGKSPPRPTTPRGGGPGGGGSTPGGPTTR